MATIRKHGPSYQVLWYRLDGSRASRTCPDKRTADQLSRDVERERALGRDWSPAPAAAVAPRLEDVAAAFIRHITRTRRPATVANYTAALGRLLDFVGAGAGIDVLSRPLVERFYDAVTSRADRRTGAVSEATRQSYVRQVERFWSWAYDREEYEAHVSRPRAIDLPALASAPTVAPTWAECDACIRELMRAPAQGTPSVVGYRVAVLLRYTGLRAGQVAALTPEDVDLDAARLTVRTGKSAQERQGRIVPMSPHLVAAIRAWGVTEGPLVGSRTYPASTARMLRDAWQRSGVRPEAWQRRPEHAFRKALVTELRRLGADTDAVERLVGHSAGLRGVYTDPDALPLVRTVALIRRIDDGHDDGRVVPLRRQRA